MKPFQPRMYSVNRSILLSLLVQHAVKVRTVWLCFSKGTCSIAWLQNKQIQLTLLQQWCVEFYHLCHSERRVGLVTVKCVLCFTVKKKKKSETELTYCFSCCKQLEKENFLENLLVLSNEKEFYLISCVFWIYA